MKDLLLRTVLPLSEALAQRTRFTLPELLGDQWEALTEQFRSQDLGLAFSRLVASGQIPNVRFVEVRRYPRISVYEKVDE